MTEDEERIVNAMFAYGGSFVKALAHAFLLADRTNFDRLRTAFSEYWANYEQIAKGQR